MAPNAVILGCEGIALTPWEKDFFSASDPLGFILFARNCQDPGQVTALVSSLRATVGRDDAPVLIDQEGGPVARLKPPHWRSAPAADRFGNLAMRDLEQARRALALNTTLLALELGKLGIDVDCLPLLDVPVPGAHDVIGSRAFSQDPALVAELGRVQAEAFLACGITPIVKHIPGHGRAGVDSHLALPRVSTPLVDLEASDFAPFRALADAPWAMTAHVVYECLDPERPATTSPAIIRQVIRGSIGFDGLLLSDDIGMQALAGDFAERGAACLDAGCDVVLHCSGKADEMAAVAPACGPMSVEASRRFREGLQRRQNWRATGNEQDILAELDHLLAAA